LAARAPLAQRATKEMAARGPHLPWEDALRLGESMRRVVGTTADAAEGFAARREGRAPNWQAR
jgi:enoyl-CoA hydratase/carnithine racemase